MENVKISLVSIARGAEELAMVFEPVYAVCISLNPPEADKWTGKDERM